MTTLALVNPGNDSWTSVTECNWLYNRLFNVVFFHVIAVEKIQSLEDFKSAKAELLRRIEELEQELVVQAQVHQQESEDAERKRILGKNKYNPLPVLFSFLVWRRGTHT